MKKIFWDKITNANRFISLIISEFSKNSFILNGFNDIPWYDYFRSERIFKEVDCSNKAEPYLIDEKECKDKFEDEKSVNMYFLSDDYCSDNMKTNYFYYYGDDLMKLPKYMAEHDEGIYIHQRYIWVEVYSQKSFENWVNFVSEYVEYRKKYVENKVIKDTACFVISCTEYF